MSNAWNKYKQMLSGFTPSEEARLRTEYAEYCIQHNKWHWKDGDVMSFDDWFRTVCDDEKERKKYESI